VQSFEIIIVGLNRRVKGGVGVVQRHKRNFSSRLFILARKFHYCDPAPATNVPFSLGQPHINQIFIAKPTFQASLKLLSAEDLPLDLIALNPYTTTSKALMEKSNRLNRSPESHPKLER
jgi:hypothetical protein